MLTFLPTIEQTMKIF